MLRLRRHDIVEHLCTGVNLYLYTIWFPLVIQYNRRDNLRIDVLIDVHPEYCTMHVKNITSVIRI